MRLSILEDSTLRYGNAPRDSGGKVSHSAAPRSSPNRAVHDAVDRVLLQLGLDEKRFGTDEWNPLGEFVKPGQKIFVLCNFVYHRRSRESLEDFQGKCTDSSVLMALLDHVVKAAGPTGSVSFGNAPIQACSWSQVLSDVGAAGLSEHYRSRGYDVSDRDLRLLVTECDSLGRVLRVERRDERDGVEVVLDGRSLLCSVDSSDVHYRVSNYEPDRIEGFHAKGRHRYVVNRHVLESDVIVSLPKLKVHEKVGITCAVKGFVGAIAHKDSLAHHRRDSPAEGGDEYERTSIVQRAMSRFHDHLQPRNARGASIATQLANVVDTNYRRVARRLGWIQFGAWHGNDTTWRMAVDLARIMHYARTDGSMSDTPVRKNIVLIDGIVGGEGEGPLSPRAVKSGILIFSDNAALADYGAACAMGFDPWRFPIVSQSFSAMRYPLAERHDVEESRCIVNGAPRSTESLPGSFSYKYAPPSGWRGWV